MLFSSLTFLFVFLPLVLICYFIVKSIKIKNIILLIFSLLFYAWGEPVYIILMVFSILVTYIFGLFIDKSRKNKKIFLIISILLLLSSLLFFKYGNFIIDNINFLFDIKINNIKLSLPIGISFYTFQALSYLIDLYIGKIEVQKNILNLGLYVTLFPQLIAGPIVRYETVESEIKERTTSLNSFVSGFKRFIIGLSKKVILSNNMALIADTIFQASADYGTLLLWIGAISYTLQIYFDFSGYSDMAIGLGKIFGFTFLENFNYPYIAKSITDFWRRWHISLSTWFKDYIYIPLGGSWVCKIKHIRNILIVWLLTGFWHGASWNFILWGLYYAILLIIEKFFMNKFINKVPNILKHIVTIFLVIIGWVIFRITDFSELFLVLKQLFVLKKDNIIDFIASNFRLVNCFYYMIPAIILCIPWKNIIKIKNNKYSEFILIFVYFFLYIVDITYLVSSTYNPFIYFRF